MVLLGGASERLHFKFRERLTVEPFLFRLVAPSFRALPLGLDVGGVRTFSGNGFSPIRRTRFFLRLMRTLFRRGGTPGVSLSAAPPTPPGAGLGSRPPLGVVSSPADARLDFFFFDFGAVFSTSSGDPRAVEARFPDLFFSLASTLSGVFFFFLDAFCFSTAGFS